MKMQAAAKIDLRFAVLFMFALMNQDYGLTSKRTIRKSTDMRRRIYGNCGGLWSDYANQSDATKRYHVSSLTSPHSDVAC